MDYMKLGPIEYILLLLLSSFRDSLVAEPFGPSVPCSATDNMRHIIKQSMFLPSRRSV